jgi:outer membrane protein TolC
LISGAHFSSTGFRILALATGVLLAASVRAEEPLSRLIAAAHRASTDERVARLVAAQQEADALVALGRALPSLSLRGVYVRNEFESKLDPSSLTGVAIPGATPVIIQRRDQLDGFAQLDVPVIDVAAWLRVSAAQQGAQGARATASSTALDVEKRVARNYYQLIGASALRASTERTLEAARANLALVTERLAGGVATELEVNRATAEVERAKRGISDAELTAELARRALQTLTGVVIEGELAPVVDDLHEELPLERWEGPGLDVLPSVAAAGAQRRSAETTALASGLALAPTVTASAQEHLTNASGFVGKNSSWLINATMTWRLDVTALGTMRSQATAAEAARVREEAARRAALDQIHEAWFRIHDGITKSRAARAEQRSAGAAVMRARERYQAGTGTQLELVQAERDAFSSEVTRIQADADLGYSRAALRLAAGHPLDQETSP